MSYKEPKFSASDKSMLTLLSHKRVEVVDNDTLAFVKLDGTQQDAYFAISFLADVIGIFAELQSVRRDPMCINLRPVKRT